MKKVFKTLSAILLATACLTPGLAWAAAPSVTLDASGMLRATDMGGVHSILVEVAFSGDGATKVTDVELKNAPSGALASAAYANGKATVAVSAGDDVLQLTNNSLGTLNVIAQGASAENPVQVDARVSAVEYLDTDDVTAATKLDAPINGASVTLKSTEGTPAPPSGNEGDGLGGNGNGNGNGYDEGDGFGSGIYGNGSNGANGANGANGNTNTADYRANGVVSQAGQNGSGANTGLVKTGDVLAICGIALGAAAVAVVIAMLVSRKKGAARK